MKSFTQLRDELTAIQQQLAVMQNDLQDLINAPAVVPAPVVAPEDTEVDVVLSDGGKKIRAKNRIKNKH